MDRETLLRVAAIAPERASLRAGVALAMILVAAHLPVALLGRSMQPATLYPYGLSARPAARRAEPVFNVDLGTPAYYEWPHNKVVGDQWRHGEVPLWDPHSAAGIPLATQYSSRVFFPYQILEDVAPATTWDFFLLGRAWLAGLFTWAFLRRHVGASHAALVGASLYMLSGSFTWFLSLEQYANVAMVAPLLLLTLDGLAVARRSRDVAAVAVATALVLLGGQPEVAFCVLALGGFWTLSRAYALYGRALAAPLGRYALGSALGIFLAAPLLLPFAGYAAAAFHYHPPGGPMGMTGPTFWAFVPGIWVPALVMAPSYPVDLPCNGRWDYLGGYSGVLPWVLVLAALARGRAHRAAMTFFAGAAAVVLLKNVAVPPFSWIGLLPVFDQVWSPRWAGPVWTLSLSIAAGLAAEALCAPRPEAPPGPHWRWTFRVAAGALALVLLRSAVAFVWEQPRLLRDGLYPVYPDKFLLSRAAVSLSVAAVTAAVAWWVVSRRSDAPRARLALVLLAAAELTTSVPRGYGSRWFDAGLIPWGLGLGAAIALVANRARLAAISGALSVVALAVIDTLSPRGLPPRRDPFAAPPWVSFVRSRVGLQRVTSVGGALFPNNAGAVGLYDVHYITSIAVKAFREMSIWLLEPSRSPDRRAWGVGLWSTGVPEMAAGPNGLAPAIVNLQLAHRLYGLFGVRYVAAPHGVPLDRPLMHGEESSVYPYRRVYSGEVDVWEHTATLPRAWIAHELRRVASTTALFAQMVNRDTDFRRTALLLPGDGPTLRGEAATPPASDESVRVVTYRPGSVTLDVRAAREGMVILSDVISEGWGAEVDGRPAPLVRVDGCLRGVWVTAGRHRIVQRYTPAGYRAGLLLAGLATLACAYAARPRRGR